MATLSSELHINKPYHRHWLASITLPDNPVMCCQCCRQTHTLFARSQSPHSSLPLYQTCKRCLTRPKLFVFVNLSLEQRCRFWCCSCVTLSVGNVEYTGWHNDMMKQWQNDRDDRMTGNFTGKWPYGIFGLILRRCSYCSFLWYTIGFCTIVSYVSSECVETLLYIACRSDSL